MERLNVWSVKGRPDERGQRARVDAARKQAAAALGRDPDAVEPSPPRYVPTEPRYVREAASSEAVTVLSLGEAAARLSVTRKQLEAAVDAGRIKALPTGYTRMIPIREIERLLGPPNGPSEL